MGNRKERPWSVVVSSCTLDGRTSPKPHTSSRVFVPLTPKMLTEKRMKFRGKMDAIMVGSETVLIDNPRLIRPNQNPDAVRVIVDSRGRITRRHRILSDQYRTVMLVTKKTPAKYKRMVSALKNKSYIECGADRVDLPLAFKKLRKMGIKKIMVEGGGTLVHQLIANKLIDEMQITYIPFFVGAKDAASLVSGTDSLFGSARLRIRKHELHDDFLYVEGKVEYAR